MLQQKGIIHILNANPNTDIDRLIQQQAQAETIVALTLLPTTTKKWNEVLNYQAQSHDPTTSIR